jgi:hypothetical protein
MIILNLLMLASIYFLISFLKEKHYGVKEPNIYYIRAHYLPIFRAIMIPHVGIFIKLDYKDDKILEEHELIHWKQYKRMGSIVFLIRYILQFIFIGYDTMPLELEARQTDSSLWNYRQRNWKK